MKILIDGNKANRELHRLYKGQGMISCNGSSRLLLDYRQKHPDTYWHILELLFGKNGLGFTHFKVEMGSDVNTSSGTEPTVMRYADEKADVRRGAGFRIAADIKKKYPHVTLDMLWWSEPRWVTDADDVYAERYRWYKSTLTAAYDTFGLKFDYVSANRNERAVEADWIIYLSKALKNETDCPYDFSNIKIVAADECHAFNISGDMLRNEELLNAVDVIGSHYISFADDNTKLLCEKYGKEIWLSEGSSPMVCAKSACRYDEGGSGLCGLNGALDIADRMIAMVSGANMTMYEYQPAAAAYYDGVTYCHKQLINAAWPWSGYFTLDSGFYMNLHFSKFMEKGWSYIPSACFCDGKEGGDGHCITGTKYSFISACGPDGDYTAVITNTTPEPITYEIEVKNLAKSDSPVFIWETRGPDGEQSFDANYFRKTAQITPRSDKFSIEVKPYSIVTVSTVDIGEPEFEKPSESENLPLSLPYLFETEFSDEEILARGGAPLYTTDEGGAFEIAEKDGEKVIMQKIVPEIKADEWGATPSPVTCFGDDRWYNYSVSAIVLTASAESYVGIGLRYTVVEPFVSGYAVHLYGNGKWKVYEGDRLIGSGEVDGFDGGKWHGLKISAVYNEIYAFVDDEKVFEYRTSCGFGAGRAALYSSYDKCCFKNIKAEASHSYYCIEKYDNLSDIVSYSGEWEHLTMSSYRNYCRTISNGGRGAVMMVGFCGCGIVLTGGQKGAKISAAVDGQRIGEELVIGELVDRSAFFTLGDLANGEHVLEITVNEGRLSVDSVQIIKE